MKRLNKEYTLKVCDKISIKYGSINKDNPQVIYVSGKCWISPQTEMDYKKSLNKVENRMKKNITHLLSDGESFDKKTILDFDLSMDGFKPNVKRFLSFDFYLRQNKSRQKKLKELGGLLSARVGVISNDLVNDLEETGFDVSISK